MDFLDFPHYFILALTAVCAVTDHRHGYIYNVFTLPAILVGLVYHTAAGGAWGLAGSAGGLLLGIVPFAFASARGWMGGGDVKLFGAIGAVGGAYLLLDILLIGFFFAGLYGVAILLRDEGAAGLTKRIASLFSRARRQEQDTRHLRLGVFVFVGALVRLTGPAIANVFT